MLFRGCADRRTNYITRDWNKILKKLWKESLVWYMEDIKTSMAAQDKWNWKTQKYGVKERTIQKSQWLQILTVRKCVNIHGWWCWLSQKSSITKGQLATAIFWFSGHTVKVSYNISQECTASTFRVTEFIQVDAEITGRKQSVSYITRTFLHLKHPNQLFCIAWKLNNWPPFS